MMTLSDELYEALAFDLYGAIGGNHKYVAGLIVMPMPDGLRGFYRFDVVVKRDDAGELLNVIPVHCRLNVEDRADRCRRIAVEQPSFDRLRAKMLSINYAYGND